MADAAGGTILHRRSGGRGVPAGRPGGWAGAAAGGTRSGTESPSPSGFIVKRGPGSLCSVTEITRRRSRRCSVGSGAILGRAPSEPTGSGPIGGNAFPPAAPAEGAWESMRSDRPTTRENGTIASGGRSRGKLPRFAAPTATTATTSFAARPRSNPPLLRCKTAPAPAGPGPRNSCGGDLRPRRPCARGDLRPRRPAPGYARGYERAIDAGSTFVSRVMVTLASSSAVAAPR